MNSSSPRPQPKRTPEPQPELKPEPMDIPDEAQREKELGNAAYKKKDFETAIQHYTKEMDLDDKDIFCITNKNSLLHKAMELIRKVSNMMKTARNY